MQHRRRLRVQEGHGGGNTPRQLHLNRLAPHHLAGRAVEHVTQAAPRRQLDEHADRLGLVDDHAVQPHHVRVDEAAQMAHLASRGTQRLVALRRRQPRQAHAF